MTFTGLSKQNPSIKMTILSLLIVSLLSGCGIQGSLKTPPPVFGGDAKVDPERVPTEDLDDDENEDEDDLDYLEDDFDDLDEDPLADF